MTTSPDLGLPYIASSQASPEITHNTALNMLQTVMTGVIAIQNAPPGSPAEGDTYLVGAAGSGAWAGSNNKFAGFFGGGWVFLPGLDSSGTPIAMGAAHEGMRTWDKTNDAGVVWTGGAWVYEGGAMRSYTVATAPAATGPKRFAYFSDESGGAVPAFNDGSNWRRVTDRAIIS